MRKVKIGEFNKSGFSQLCYMFEGSFCKIMNFKEKKVIWDYYDVCLFTLLMLFCDVNISGMGKRYN